MVIMGVPNTFADKNPPTVLQLSALDANFSYLTNTPTLLGLTVTNTLAVNGASSFSGSALFNNISINGAITIHGNTFNPTGVTGTGDIVLNTNPVLVTPNLGVPSFLDLTNATNLPIASIIGIQPSLYPFLATPNSVNLRAAVVDETGTGALVFANGPTLTNANLVTPALGIPSSGDLRNCTNYPTSALAGLGAGVAAALAINVGTTGSIVLFNGALGAPSSGNLTNCTGLPLATGVTGILPISNGGTNLSTLGAGVGAALGIAGNTANGFAILNSSGVLPIAQGGTNSSTQQAAINSLTATAVLGTYLRGDGTNAIMSPIIASDVPTLNQNTTGSAATFTSTTQNSQFNSIGVGVAATGVSGVANVGNGVQFPSTTIQTDAAIGYGQTWQNFTGTRAAGVTYTNTTTKPITVNLSLLSNLAGNDAFFAVGGVTVANLVVSTGGGNYGVSTTVVVPIGATYSLNYTVGSFTIRNWAELR